MTKKLKVYLLILIAAVCAACTVAGCRVGNATKSELISGYSYAHVTYYGNRGLFNSSTTITVRDIYFAEHDGGVPFYEIGESDPKVKQSQVIDRNKYDLIGWFEAVRYTAENVAVYGANSSHIGELVYYYQENSDSAPVYVYPVYEKQDGEFVYRGGNKVNVTDSENDRPMYATEEDMDNPGKYYTELQVCVLFDEEKQLDQTRMLVKGEELAVCAKWEPTQKIVYILDYEGELADKDGKIYKSGDVVNEQAFGSDESTKIKERAPSDLVKPDDVTFVGYYMDKQGKEYVSNTTVTRGGGADITVYAKYVPGKWNLISKATEVKNVFTGSDNYYILCDIDCSSVDSLTLKANSYAAKNKIEGAGHKLYNLTFNTPGGGKNPAVAANSTSSMFGRLGSGASVTNLTLENVTVNLKAAEGAGIYFYAVCESCASSASLQGLTINGLTATLTVNVAPRNVDDDNKNSWLFGGATAGDSKFAEDHGVTYNISDDQPTIVYYN